jgi:hypothetical protein
MQESIVVDEKNFMVKKFGTLDVEVDENSGVTEAYVIEAKTYSLYKSDGNAYKLRAKGVSFSDKCLYEDGVSMKSVPKRYYSELH